MSNTQNRARRLNQTKKKKRTAYRYQLWMFSIYAQYVTKCSLCVMLRNISIVYDLQARKQQQQQEQHSVCSTMVHQKGVKYTQNISQHALSRITINIVLRMNMTTTTMTTSTATNVDGTMTATEQQQPPPSTSENTIQQTQQWPPKEFSWEKESKRSNRETEKKRTTCYWHTVEHTTQCTISVSFILIAHWFYVYCFRSSNSSIVPAPANRHTWTTKKK